MKLYQYLFLDEEMQYQTIWDIGQYIKAVNRDGIKYVLYAINDFYVEIMYQPQDK